MENEPKDIVQNYEDKEFLEDNKPVVEVYEEVDDVLVDVRESNNQKVTDIDHKVVIAATTDVLHSSKEKVRNMYTRYQDKWLKYVKRVGLTEMTNENKVDRALLGFFIEVSTTYAPSTLYVIYSCINSWFIMNHGWRINNCLRVNRYLKMTTSTYVSQKSKVLTADEIDILLKFCTKSSYHEDTLLGVTLCLQYYGLLRNADVMKIEVKDVRLLEDGKTEIRFEHARKRRNPGFTFYVPSDYKQLFLKYIGEIDMTLDSNTRFLKNFTMLESKRTQNTGYKKISNFIKRACLILGKNPEGYTGHCMRRSAATNLADSGVSFVNLKRHGQWKSDTVVEGYIANSEPVRMERLIGLLPKKKTPRSTLKSTVFNPYKKLKPTKFQYLSQDLRPSSDEDSDGDELLNYGSVFEKKDGKLANNGE